MAVKIVVDTLEDVPEHLRGEYQEHEGRFVLRTEGELPEVVGLRTKVNEFRANNTKYLKERDDALAKLKPYEGVDLSEITQLKQRVSEFEKNTGAVDPKNVSTLIAQQVEQHVGPLKAELARERELRETRERSLARKNVESALRDAAVKAGVEDVALPDFLSRGLGVFDFVEDRVVAKNADGSPVFSRQTAGAELSPEEWAFGLAETAPHLFRASNGGGAPGGSGGNGGASDRGGQRWVDGSNVLEMGRNLEDIAAGRVKVATR